MKERLQKVLSNAGFGSRREIERLIVEGLVKINNDIAELGAKVEGTDKIYFKGKLISNPLLYQHKTRILLYHKPVGEISSRCDPKHLHTVFDNLPPLKKGRWVQVGRLDINTSGLLIFTNNGALANELMHPKFGLEREYAVRVNGEVKPEIIKNLLHGVSFEGGIAKFRRIEFCGGGGKNSWYKVILTEGKNREVRKLWQTQGITVSRLIRIRYGKFKMPRALARGRYFELSPQEVEVVLASSREYHG